MIHIKKYKISDIKNFVYNIWRNNNRQWRNKRLNTTKSDFKVEKDMCKATKREDVLAYLVTLDVDLIEKQIREEYDL